MTTLKELYTTLKSLRDMNLPVDDKLLMAADKLEEKIIKEEILPTLSHNIEPQLSEIQRDLILVVEYHPGEPLSVALSRRAKISDFVDAKQLTPKRESTRRKEVSSEKKEPQKVIARSLSVKKAPAAGLCVWISADEFIQEEKAAYTFAKAIELAGASRVASLNIILDGENIVSKKKHPVYYGAQQSISNGYLVNTHSNTESKKRHLDLISKRFHLGWRVVIIK